MTNSIPINPHVSPTMHPDMLEPLSNDLADHPALQAGRYALGEIYRSATAMVEAERRLKAFALSPGRIRTHPNGRSEYLGDMRMTHAGIRMYHGHEEEFAEAAAHRFAITAKAFDARYAEVEAHRKRGAEAVNARLAFEGPSALAQEVRTFLRALPSKEDRLRALMGGDQTMVTAALGAPPYLSGIEAEDAQMIRENAEKRFAPKEAARRDALELLAGRMRDASSIFMDVYSRTQPKNTPRKTARAIMKEAAGE